MLEKAINEYLLWMISKGYAQRTWDRTENVLRHFSLFVRSRKIAWKAIFTQDTLKAFQKETGRTRVSAVRGLARYLFEQKRISAPIQKKIEKLPRIYEEYLYCARSRQISQPLILCARRVLTAFYHYLQGRKISLPHIRIEQIDAFWEKFNIPFAQPTWRQHRWALRGFLRYLYQKGIIKKDLALLLVGPPMFSQAKPPRFLRAHEVQRLFNSLDTSSAKGLRRYALCHCAYTLGLRPCEISLIHLDDISFHQRELVLRARKCANPIKLPLPEETIKAIAAYVVGARPKESERSLFLRIRAPHTPMSAAMVSHEITHALRGAKLPGSAYWLRHTYAQNLLENGASIFEIKQMLGHESIQTTKRYIHIHIQLMREVILDETL